MRATLALLVTTLLVGGCNKQVTVRQVCESQPQMCSDLNKDGHCNAIRSEVIVKRFIEHQDPTDENKFSLLIDFDKYSSCIHLASQIEHIKLKEKKTSRVNGYLTSLREIKRLTEETQNTQHPGLLYYQWSHNNDEAALEKFLKLEQTDAMQTTQMQLLLATYYIKLDLEKTIDLLYRALELNPQGGQPDTDIYKSLVNIFYKQKKYKHAYIWALIARENEVDNIEIAPLENLLLSQGKSLDKLQDLADKTNSQIEQGQFFSPR